MQYDVDYRAVDAALWTRTTELVERILFHSLTDGQEYEVRVRAVNEVGNGRWSDIGKGTPFVATPTPTPLPQAARRDRQALVNIYNSANGDDWSDNYLWLSDERIEDWGGVSINSDARVNGLYRNGQNLTGSISSSIGSLSDLEVLDMSENSLGGRIPSQIGNLRKLNILELDDNSLTGSIPSQLGNLDALTELDLSNNSLSGGIPSHLGNADMLSRLDLSDNDLTGLPPNSLASLAYMTTLDLSNNNFSGDITNWLRAFLDRPNGHLTYIYLRGNSNLTGCVPEKMSPRVSHAGVNLPDC